MLYKTVNPRSLRSFHKVITATAVLFLLTAGCSTKKNTFFSRNYHGVTTKYNGYFNARLRVQEGAAQLAKSHEDKYDRILKVFRFADPQKAKAVYPDMDEAIKKASLVIERHSMEIKGREYNAWIDDSYLLVGQAYFYKHDFFSALEAFQYVASNYKYNAIRFDALVWEMKADLELGRYYDAQNIYDFVSNNKDFPSRLRSELYATAASMALQVSNYPQAIEYLGKAVASEKKRDKRTRYTYILAQLYQHEGDYPRAFALYERVIKLNPPYEMAFSAKINRARSFDPEGKNSKEIRDQLTKMLRDDKNAEYLDQIYYALAGLSQKESNEPEAIDFLNKSVAASTSNTNQKALSYLELAKIYFGKPEYRKAQIYYDSTVTFLSKEHPDYTVILNTRNSLNSVVENLNTIELQDSLQVLAALPAAEREKAIDDIVKREQEEFKKKQEEALAAKAQEQLTQQLLNDPNNKPGGIQPPGVGTGWYFYNTAAVSFGYTEFLKKWGNRKLEDHWRRSNKASIIVNEEGEGAEGDSLSATAGGDDAGFINNKARYLRALPVSVAKKEASDAKIMLAMYSLGTIYREQLLDYQESIMWFELLMKRYPENENKVAALFQLYRAYLALGNDAKANEYKNIILTKYPDSEYANIILNPETAGDKSKKFAKLNEYYEQTYNAYKDRQFAEVIARKDASDSLFPHNHLSAKFDFLKALAVGKTQDMNSFETQLQGIIINYPTDSVKVKAQELIDYLQTLRGGGTQQITALPEIEKYVYQPEAEHYIQVAFPNKSVVDQNDLKVKISNYNSKYYSLNNYTVSSMFLSDSLQVIIISRFDKAATALDYYDSFYGNTEVFEEAVLMVAEPYAISLINQQTLYKDKDLAHYLDYFRKKYNR